MKQGIWKFFQTYVPPHLGLEQKIERIKNLSNWEEQFFQKWFGGKKKQSEQPSFIPHTVDGSEILHQLW